VLYVRWQLVISPLCLVLVGGCTSKANVTANDSDNGRHIQINSGQILDIGLADDYQTSGCQWRDEQKYDAAVLKYLGARYQSGGVSSGDTGGSTYTSRYKAVGAGTVHVTLVQQNNANPPRVARHFALDVTVR
jgi:predicted secreted protein